MDGIEPLEEGRSEESWFDGGSVYKENEETIQEGERSKEREEDEARRNEQGRPSVRSANRSSYDDARLFRSRCTLLSVLRSWIEDLS